ncbi:hypothetical protein ACOHYD_13630 [Desulfobacterota bacterium M19]
MSVELTNTLVDVRKAYRLVYLYQKNILSTIDRFAQEFQCSFYWWTPTETAPPPQRSTDITKRWVWDLLPLYSTALLYYSEGGQPDDHSPGEWLLALHLTTDDEFESDGEEPNPVNFEKAEDSDTTINVTLWYCKKAMKENWFYGVWNELEYPDEEYCEYDSPEGLICVQKEFSLNELENEELIIKATQDFKNLLNSHIPTEDWT